MYKAENNILGSVSEVKIFTSGILFQSYTLTRYNCEGSTTFWGITRAVRRVD